MDNFLASRRSDPKFAHANSRVDMSRPLVSTQWYREPPRGVVRFRGETVTHTFAEMKKEEKEKKSDSGSSESDGEGGRRKKKKQRKGTCWEGYHRVEGTKQYADGSCAKN